MKRIICVMICTLFIITETVTKQTMRILPKNEDVRTTKIAAQKKCNNLICLFDSHQIESTFGSNCAMTFDLIMALQEKAAPIIVTTNILQRFCYWKTYRFEVVKRFGYSFFIQKVLFANFDGWYCYFHKRSGLALLVPQTYIDSHVVKQSSNKEDPLVQCGFDMTNLNQIKKVSYSAILDYIEKNQPDYNKIIDAFESIIVKNTTNSSSPISTWNIYVSGHGDAAIRIKAKKQDEQNIINAIKQLERRVQAIKRGEVNVYEEELIQNERKLKKLLRQLKQIRLHGLSWETREFDVAGLLYEDFMQLMIFFEQDIKTSYVHYDTCFAGGLNQLLVNQELASLNVNFIVSAQGINEDSALGSTGARFAPFFAKLEALMCGTIIESIKDQELRDALIKDSIADILESVINRSYLDYTQPFVRIPSIGVFKALDMAREVQLLTRSVAKAHEAEGSFIDYTEPSIVTIVLYPSHIIAPLKIKDHVAIVSPAPQSIKEIKTPTIHIFEKIFYQDNLFSIIPNFVSFNMRYQRIIFIIKELHCSDSQYLSLGLAEGKEVVIKDMIIQISPIKRSRSSDLDISIDVTFNYNGQYYSISKKIEAIRWNQRYLFSAFKNGIFEQIKDENLLQLAEKIIGKSGIAILEKKHKEITLSSMVEYFEERIDGSLRIENAKDFKYAVLLKKIKKFERITSDVALKLQKEFVTKTGSMPGLSWVHRLERLISSSQDMLNHINGLMGNERENSIVLSYKQKIEKVLKILTQEYESAITQLSWKEWSFMNIEPVSKKVQKIRNDIMDRIKQMQSYIRGEARQKYGYGKPR